MIIYIVPSFPLIIRSCSPCDVEPPDTVVNVVKPNSRSAVAKSL